MTWANKETLNRCAPQPTLKDAQALLNALSKFRENSTKAARVQSKESRLSAFHQWLMENQVFGCDQCWAIEPSKIEANHGIICKTNAFEKIGAIAETGNAETTGEEKFHLWMRVPRNCILAESDARESILGRVLGDRLRSLTNGGSSQGCYFQ